MRNIQTSTTLGFAGITQQILSVVGDKTFCQLWDFICVATIGEVMHIVIPFCLFGYSIFHDENKIIGE